MNPLGSTWFKACVSLVLWLVAGLLLSSVLQAVYQAGYDTAESEGKAELSRLREQHAEQKAAAAGQAAVDAKEAARKLQAEQQRADGMAASMANEQRAHRKTTDRLVGEITRVNDLYRAALDAPPEPLPACVFTRGFVRVWNEATGAAPGAERSSRTTAQGAQTNAADQLDAGISRADVLEHHVRYAEQCRNTASQLDALIDVIQGNH